MSVIVPQASRPYVALMSLRSLTAMLIALAMLFAPLALQSGAAMAMAPADHHSQMSKGGHCDGQSPQRQDSGAPDKSCCAAMCTAVAVAPALSIEPHALAPNVDRPRLDLFHHSFLAELPTPPPRLA